MDEPTTVVKATTEDAGCWVDGVRGWHALAYMVVNLATHRCGYPLSDEDRAMVELYDAGQRDLTDEVHEIADEAEAWLNEHVAPDGYTFLWIDGDFCLIDDEELPE
jgi:hypothetical protein